MFRYGRMLAGAALALGILSLVVGCKSSESEEADAGVTGPAAAKKAPDSGGAAEKLSGSVAVDGSSTVYPITEAVAEEFRSVQPDVKVTVGISGTGGGMKKFAAGETDISDASRPIKASEVEAAQAGGVEFIELPVAYDALAVVINPENTWATTLTVEELRRTFEPAAEGTVTKWSDIRAGFPDAPLVLYAAGVDSGTYDYFTEAICGEEGASRGDMTTSEDDNVLVQGVAGDVNALGFFGVAYYQENKDLLTAVLIDDGDPDNGDGGIAPEPANVINGTYQPLSRPLFIYVNTKSKEKPQVKAFVDFYLSEVRTLAREVGYVELPDAVYAQAQKRFELGTTGSVFAGGGSKVGVSLEDLLAAEEAGA